MSGGVARLDSATLVYGAGERRVTAVSGATVEVAGGKVVGIVGPSGSGKTTLMSMLGTLLLPTSGAAYFDGRDVSTLSVAQRRALRLGRVGFVFQQLRLMQKLSALENVRLPLVLAGREDGERLRRASELVKAVGLEGKEGRRPGELSVGEQQRVAVARALVNSPALVLADEPTSQLDSASGQSVLELLEGLCAEIGAAVVISTHDQKMRERLGEVYEMRDGVLSQG
ncbi:MAG: ABC transporter ATP-binding protein [Nitrososphaerota archaeon]|nr:ABC transporter ATP-binding protein [Nitrososphaerota archaeon]